MGEPIIINDGSPVKITWLGDHGWIADQQGLSLTRDGGLKLKWIMFNLDLFGKVDVNGPLQMKVNFKLKSENSGQTLLVSTDANGRNLRLEVADPKGKKFADFFAPPPNSRKSHKFQTPKDASITGITYQIGSRKPQKGRTLKLLPTSIYLELASDDE